MKNLKKNSGITLIALALTIIVLLILTSITFQTLVGEQGILARTTSAKLAMEQAQILEVLRLEMYEKSLTPESNATNIEWLKNKEMIKQEIKEVAQLGRIASLEPEVLVTETPAGEKIYYMVDVTKVIDGASTGRGEFDTGDVYYILTGNLYYMDSHKKANLLGKVFKESSVPKKMKWLYTENAEGNVEITQLDFSEANADINTGTYGTKISLDMETLTIPSQIDGKNVVKVNLRTGYETEFNSSCEITGIKEIIFGDTIEEITSGIGFEDIERVHLPNNLKTIPDALFWGCNNLTSITIPKNVMTIGERVFNTCSSLTQINVDNENEYFCSENGILFNKDKTTIIRYPEGKKDVSYSIPESVTSIKNGAFDGCSNLTNIVIPEGVTSIEDYAFGGCSSLTNIVIPESVTSIGNYAFYNCRALAEITIPKSVTTIKNRAFYVCDNLTLNFEQGINEGLTIPEDKWGAKAVLIEGVEYTGE